MVPAFAGLGAPHWAPDARGAVFGLTRGTTNAHFVRAALESVCYQTSDLLHAMAEDGVSLDKIRVDGGMVGNNWLCQFLAGILDVTVERPKIMETTALGAAYLAGLKAGIYQSCEQLASMNEVESSFEASMASSQRRKLISGWENAVQSTLGYSK